VDSGNVFRVTINEKIEYVPSFQAIRRLPVPQRQKLLSIGTTLFSGVIGTFPQGGDGVLSVGQ
jgi:hypothetical protein